MERRYPYIIEMVDRNRVCVERTVGRGVVIPEYVWVDIPLYRKTLTTLPGLAQNSRANAIRGAVEEAKILAYDKFIVALQVRSEYVSGLPLDYLRAFTATRYSLLVPTAHWNVLRLRIALPGMGRALRARYDEYEFDILPHPRLQDDEAYLVDPEKYRLYLQVREGSDEAYVYRSEFLDRKPDSMPPLLMSVRQLLRELTMSGEDAETASADVDGKKTEETPRAACPNCQGRLLFLSPEEAFCLDCDWDNLKILSHSAAYTE